jgi:mono/diheme cytochrome c family protein
MKLLRNIPPRTLEYLLGILATSMIVVGLFLYALQEPTRIVQAQAAQQEYDLDEAMTLYAENCAVCHGLAGDGIAASPALNNPILAQMDADGLYKIIARGVSNTAMPAWSQEDGGPLGAYQVGQLVTLIQSGNWQSTQDRVVNLGLAPLVPFTTEPDLDMLESVRSLPDGELLANAIELYAAKCVACHGPDGAGTALAPALNDPEVRLQSSEEVERVILNGVPSTLMAGWGNVLSSEETVGLVSLIQRWEEIPQGVVPEPEQAVPVTAESLLLGETLYSQNCSRCHGPEGQGTQRAPALNIQSFLIDTNDSAIQAIVSLGVPETSMPAWGDRMTEDQIQAIVGFLRSWEPNAPAVAQPVRITGPWWANQPGAILPSGGAASPPGGTTEQHAQSQPTPTVVAGQTDQSQANPLDHAQQSQPTGTPPWMQELQVPWYEKVDWRAVWLISGTLVLGLAIVIWAAINLRRLGGMLH